MSRKKLGNFAKTQPTTTKISSTLKRDLKQLAKENNKTLSATIAEILEKEIANSSTT